MRTRRIRNPEVLADICPDQDAAFAVFNQYIDTEGNLFSVNDQAASDDTLARSKPAPLIEFTIGRKIGLWNNADDLSFGNIDCAIVETVFKTKRHADSGRSLKLPARFLYAQQPFHCPVQQNTLLKQIRTRITRNGKLRKHQKAAIRMRLHDLQNMVRVIGRIARFQGWNSC